MNWTRRLFRILSMPCLDATQLSSQSMDEELDLPEQLAPFSHIGLCRSCRSFHTQIRRIREAIRKINEPGTAIAIPASGEGLSQEARDRISQLIQNELRTGPGGSTP